MPREARDRVELRRAGFTLVEVLISVAILAMIATTIWGAFTQTAGNRTRLEEQGDRYHVVRVALERMARELTMAYVSAQLNPDPTLQLVQTAFVGSDEGHRDRVDFNSFSHARLYRDAHESDQNELSYFVTRNPDGDGDVLARREDSVLDDQPTRGGRVEVLATDVEAFDLEYLDGATKEWTRNWDTRQAAEQPNRLPLQVKIILTIKDPTRSEGRRTFGTRATLPMTFGLNHAVYNP